MLTLDQVTVLFGDSIILDRVSFGVRRGERVALIGANGAGKSTLLRVAGDLLDPTTGAVRRDGTIGYLEQSLTIDISATAWEQAGAAFQRVMEIERELEQVAAHLAREDSGDREALLRHQGALHSEMERLDGYTIEARIAETLAGLGFTSEAMHQPISTLSGGWRARVALAQLLLRGADYLLLDEPTNHLDDAATEWLEEYLRAWPAGVLVVSHDRFFLDRVTTRTLELRQGEVTDFPMRYSQYVVERRARDDRQRLSAQRQARDIARQQASIDRFRAKPSRASRAHSQQKRLDRIERIATPLAERSISLAFPLSRLSGQQVLVLDRVDKGFDGRSVLRNVSLEIARGERVGIVGPNGAGKSTMLRLIAGSERPDRGTITHGHAIDLAHYEQLASDAFAGETSAYSILLGTRADRVSETEARGALGAVGLSGDAALQSAGRLSGGERSRLALARLGFQSANVILLDEPTNHLDIPSREILEEAILAFEGTVLIASHDRYLLERVATRILAVGDGAVRSFPGTYARYRDRAARGIPVVPAPERGAPRVASDALTAMPAPPVDSAAPVKAGKDRADHARLRRIETRLESLQAEREELEQRPARSDLWKDVGGARLVVERLAAVQGAIDGAKRDWDAIADRA